MSSPPIHEAFKAGNLDALRTLIGPEFPHGEVPSGFAPPLEYAIYHSPLPFVRSLLALGADPNYASDEGYPSLLAALSANREDKHLLLEVLLSAGADPGQRGINDWTPVHYAASQDDPRAIEILAARGADLQARTRIDDRATPLEEAEILGKAAAMKILKQLLGS
jgi:uncharacterized protein